MGWQSCTDKGSFTRAILDALAREYDFSLDTPFQDYPQRVEGRSGSMEQKDVPLRFIIKAREEKVCMMWLFLV